MRGYSGGGVGIVAVGVCSGGDVMVVGVWEKLEGAVG